MARERFAGSPPGLIPGIGPKTAERASSARGSPRSARSRRPPTTRLTDWFGPRLGPYLGRLARFEDDRRIETERVAKSESRETTFDTDLRGLAELAPELRRLTEQLCGTLEHAEQPRAHDRHQGPLRRLLHRHQRALGRRAGERARLRLGGGASSCCGASIPPRPVRLIGVRVAGLDEEQAAVAAADQLTLSLSQEPAVAGWLPCLAIG